MMGWILLVTTLWFLLLAGLLFAVDCGLMRTGAQVRRAMPPEPQRLARRPRR